MQRRKTLIRAVMAVLLTGALVGLASPSPASAAASSFNDDCFGYVGTFKGGTQVVWADWNSDDITDECFGIAPSRTIWHAWPQSGGWQEMPNHGLADKVDGAGVDLNGTHKVRVYVSGSRHYYESELWPGVGWQGWYLTEAG
ncbi:hypothetical protein ODJ79_32830 [Actinoplanes sp. KI2]|uniref:hypothetical protein n=1 Tax=Actinoplanes sp. KI2 TaxID=2983315 RepID=UPI0021D5746B|nr:hypothetical protein [Actinoplanes sp. KI2]MCU7728522.1 hypothetical protein [Actinoplanes sp. KI2]